MPKTREQLIAEWIPTEAANIKTKQREALEAKGYKELYNLPEGTTTITIHTDMPPRTSKTVWGDKKVLRITVDNKEQDLMISPNSPLWKEIIKKLAQGTNTLKIVRAGTGKTTRYSVLS